MPLSLTRKKSGKMSIKAYKYCIYPHKATTEKLQWVLDRCRELYNAGLQERRDAYEIAVRRHPNYYDDEARKQLTREHAVGYYEQKRELVDIKEERSEYQEIASHVLQDVILRLKKAYDDFFRRVKNGEQPGYPRFQGPNRYDSFTYPDGAGWKLDAKERKPEKKLAQAQQALSRKKRGSHRRKKAIQQVARCHRKIANQRRDFQHKASRKLVNQYQVIVFEDLRVKNLTKAPAPKQDENGKYLPNGAAAKAGLNKSILDAGWSTLTEMVSVKAAWAGRTVVFVNPFMTSQLCSGCGTVVKKDLSERWHSCTCGTELDRDTNSAKLILNLGYQQLSVGTRPTSATA